MTNARAREVLVIGFGNECRGDDAIGPVIARRIASWRLPQVRAAAMHQLTPEVAEELGAVERVIFVDARVDGHTDPIAVDEISADSAVALSTHFGDPRALLALSQILYGRAPQAWLVTIAGERFDPGEPLSELALQRIGEAIPYIEWLLRTGLPQARRA